MPVMRGPVNDLVDIRTGLLQNPPLHTPATTLGDAICDYENRFSVTIEPYDGASPQVPLVGGEKKYFYFTSERFQKILVDIHVKRGGLTICPKQDLKFALLSDDEISIGALVC